jgi:hypothetical protein
LSSITVCLLYQARLNKNLLENIRRFCWSQIKFAGYTFRKKNVNQIWFILISPSEWGGGRGGSARSESAELMENFERQQMLPALMEVGREKIFTYSVDFIQPGVSIIMTYESIIPLQDMLVLCTGVLFKVGFKFKS